MNDIDNEATYMQELVFDSDSAVPPPDWAMVIKAPVPNSISDSYRNVHFEGAGFVESYEQKYFRYRKNVRLIVQVRIYLPINVEGE